MTREELAEFAYHCAETAAHLAGLGNMAREHLKGKAAPVTSRCGQTR
jgi:hypothetical protein